MMKLVLFLIPLLLILPAGCVSRREHEPPETAKDNTTAEYFGTTVADPYRWLEDASAPRVKTWIEEQNRYTDRILSSFPEGRPLAERIETLAITSVQRFSPRLAHGKMFFLQFTPPQPQPVVAYREWPNGEVKVLIDPNQSGGNAAVTGFWPSPGGSYLAYGTAVGGSEATTIHFMNVNAGKDLPETIPHAGGGTTPAALVWDADEKGFMYVRLPLPGSVPETDLQFNAALYHHTLGRPVSSDELVFGENLSRVAEYTFIASEDGRRAAMFVHFGDGNPDRVYLRDGREIWKQVLDESANVRVASDVNSGACWAGDRLLVISYENAPLGRLLAIDSDGRSTVLLTQADWSFTAVSPVKGGFLITEVLGPDWKIDQYDSRGEFVRTVGLPQKGIGIGSIASSGSADDALITYSGWNIPDTWAQYDCTNGGLKTIFSVKPAADYSGIKFQIIDAVSKDGTRIPVTVLYMGDTPQDGKSPAIVYGYGGYGIPTAPSFAGPYLAWLEHGGVMGFANLRGGDEFGEGWHEAGMLGRKQNVFDDMYAAAEAMVQNHWTNREQLGILGGSNGGLLMGAELTQHPDAFKAVVSFVGIYDMLRSELFPNGEYNVSEYGTVTREQDFRWLYGYSPYHHVRSGTDYPATLLVTGENDPRVAPWQSRKFAAALQAANASRNHILLLTRMDEGHGVTASFSQRVGNTTAELTFFAHELGLQLK